MKLYILTDVLTSKSELERNFIVIWGPVQTFRSCNS